MKKTASLSFKCTQELRETVEGLAKAGDRSVSMQLVKIIREWLEMHGHQPAEPQKPEKRKKKLSA